MKTKKIRINNGPSFKGIISTLAGLYIIIALIFIFLIFASDDFEFSYLTGLKFICSIPFALVLFLVMSGTDINIRKRTIRSYRNYYLFKIGKSHSLDLYNLLVLERERFSYGTTTPTGNHSNSHHSYNVLLSNDDKSKIIILKEFTNYDGARKFYDSMSKCLNFEKIDIVVEELKNRKPSRR